MNNILITAQVVSIASYIVTVFWIYKTLVAQKDATIEGLKERINGLKEKNIELENQSPDILVERLVRRSSQLEDELKVLDNEKNKDENRIKELEIKLIQTTNQIRTFSGDIEKAEKSIRTYRRSSAYLRSHLLSMYGEHCQICGASEALEICHLKPRREGGDTEIDNVLLLCANHHRILDSGKIDLSTASLKIHPDHKIKLN